MDLFTPSLDWDNEVVASLLWVAKAWAVSAAVTLVALFVIARLTTWGRQFWRVTGTYFTGRQSVRVWALLAVLLLSVMLSVKIDVLFTFNSNDMFSALEKALSNGSAAVKASGVEGFWRSVVLEVVLIAGYVARTLLDLYLMQRFIIRWRVWLTDRLTGDWLSDAAYYRGRFVSEPIDNPDQRIQQDIDIFTTGTGPETNTPTVGTSTTLLFGAVNSVVSVVAFTPILWNLSGPLTFLGFTLPKALFWIALAYVALATVVSFWIGRPMIRLSFRNELTNAAFRYSLVRMRDAAEAVGLYRGERAERQTLSTRFAAIITNYRAAIIRLYGLVLANEETRTLPRLACGASEHGALELDGVEVRTPAGASVVDPLDLVLAPGESLVITGPSGSGKSTLMRSLAQLWPFSSGMIRRPGGVDEDMFLSQLPYMPLGDLRTAVSYPGLPGDFGDAAIAEALNTVALGHLASRLDEGTDWSKVLSPGEQQRVAFARVLLSKPRAVFLDEATSALDDGQEFALYRALRTALPDCIVVSVSHRSGVEQHHAKRLRLLGDGRWELGPTTGAFV